MNRAVLTLLFVLTAAGARAAIDDTLSLTVDLATDERDNGGGHARVVNVRVTLEDSAATPLYQEDLCGLETVGSAAELDLCLGLPGGLGIPFEGTMYAHVEGCYDRDGCDGVLDPGECSPRNRVEARVKLPVHAFAHAAYDTALLGGADPETFLQELDYAHPLLSIAERNTVDLSPLANSSLGYDNAGRLLSLTDGSGTLTVDLGSLAQALSRAGSTVTLSNGGGSVSVDDADADPANETTAALSFDAAGRALSLQDAAGTLTADLGSLAQALSRTGSVVTLSNGGGSVSVDDADADPANETNAALSFDAAGRTLSLQDAAGTLTADLGSLAQTLSRTGSVVTLSDGGGSVSVDDADASPTNERNTSLTFDSTSNVLSLQDAGGTLTASLGSLASAGGWTPAGSGVVWTNRDVGVNTSAPGADLDVNGTVRANVVQDRNNPAFLVDPASTGLSLNAAGALRASRFEDSTSPVYYLDPSATGVALQLAGWAVLNGGISAEGLYDGSYYVDPDADDSAAFRGGASLADWVDTSSVKIAWYQGPESTTECNTCTHPCTTFPFLCTDANCSACGETTYIEVNLDINGSARADAWFTTSDAGLKQDVAQIPDALDRVLRLRGVSYNRVDAEPEPRERKADVLRGSLGFIAQEVQDVVPQLVQEVPKARTDGKAPEDRILAVQYDGVIPLLVEAVKQQQEMIRTLQQQVADLQGR